MKWETPNLNLLIAWLWILAGFASGALLGLRFTREDWLGGYASLRRRMYRLGHISFFGLGTVNLLFYLTVNAKPNIQVITLSVASWTFAIGALTMPICCLVLAHRQNLKPYQLFALPVTALLTGGLLTLWMLVPL